MKFGTIGAVVLVSAALAACTTTIEYKISDITEARALSEHGMALFVAGDTDGALKALNAVIAYGSIDANDYARRAVVYGTAKDYDKAIADANRVVELAPYTWRGYLERAILLQRTGQYDAAIRDLDSAHDLQPERPELLRRRAYLKVVAARFDEAIADYELLTKLSPRSDTGALGRGAALYLAGRWTDAADQFNAMLALKPEDGLAALWLAKARMRAGRFLGWDELEAHAGAEPEWAMTHALLTVEGEDEVTALVAKVEPCERALFLGAWRLKRPDRDGAVREFRAAQKACPLDSIEASETRVEIERLTQPPLQIAPE